MMQAMPSKPITKGDIINRLIAQYGFTSFLEYNKFDGASYYGNVVCAHKELAYLPEDSYLDAANIKRLLGVASQADCNSIMDLQQLQTHFGERKFDVIFFDPVHIRPAVDQALQALPRLLKPGGVLVVHDCNPEHFELTTLRRRPGSWVGETFKAFALFRNFNRAQTLTISEDFGVGLIWNRDLNLDYSINFDLSYHDYALDKKEYIGLIEYGSFLSKTASGKIEDLFQQERQQHKIKLRPREFGHGGPEGLPAPAPKDKFEAQLFWYCQGMPYAEQRSQIQYWDKTGGSQIVRFQLPADLPPLIELRFDFTDQICSANLELIRLCDRNGQTLAAWDSPLEVLRHPANLSLYRGQGEDSGLYLRADTADPNLRLGLSAVQLEQLRSGEACLEVQLSPLPSSLHALLQSLPNLETGNPLSPLHASLLKQVMHLQRRNANLENRLITLDKLCAEWRRAPI